MANGVVYSSQDVTPSPGRVAAACYALNAATGATLWSFATTLAFTKAVSSPAVANGVVYVGLDRDVYALGAATGTPLWSAATGNSVLSSPAVAGVVYVRPDDGNLYAASTGGAPAVADAAAPRLSELQPDLRLVPTN